MSIVSAFASFLLDRCPSCGLSATTLCARCWYVLNEVGEHRSPAARGLLTIETEPFVQRALYWWDDRVPRPSNILREVILASKEHPSSATMNLWAREFCRRAMLDGLLSSRRNWVVIPPPGRSGMGEDDHAGALASAFTAVSGGGFFCEIHAFERVGKSRSSQKTKSRGERAEIEFRIAVPAKKRLERAAGFIFIDDVLATGATARAAWVALGRPHAFECWTIAAKVREEIKEPTIEPAGERKTANETGASLSL